MQKYLLVFVGLILSNFAIAAPSTYVELGYVTGGENGENGSGEEDGLEVAGSYAFNSTWYAGGVIGSYDREVVDNDYLNINGGLVRSLTPKTDFIAEAGLWVGEEKDAGGTTDPKSIEGKLGVNTMITDQFSLFGTISLIAGDLDTGVNDDLRNFVWSAGGAYSFANNISVSLKIVEGSNGVNGQSDIVRIGGRWTF